MKYLLQFLSAMSFLLAFVATQSETFRPVIIPLFALGIGLYLGSTNSKRN